jgi:deoxyhypusine synthase
MVEDPDCTVFLTLSGAMTIAKMGLVVCDMIDTGMVQYIASTGALMAHGLIESVGLHHYKYNPCHNDKLLAAQSINRVTDTLEPEENFTHLDEILDKILKGLDPKQPLASAIFHQLVGKYLHDNYPRERGILKSAYEKKVPVVVPAFIDSEIGNDVYVHNCWRREHGLEPLVMNMELDTKLLLETAVKAKRKGIFTIGGGVPRNNTQNVAPLIEIANARLNWKLPEDPFYYGCKIAPDKMFYGHLSGCTYSEGMSWRKMNPQGRFTEVHTDATIAWPIMVKYVMENRHQT